MWQIIANVVTIIAMIFNLPCEGHEKIEEIQPCCGIINFIDDIVFKNAFLAATLKRVTNIETSSDKRKPVVCCFNVERLKCATCGKKTKKRYT